MFARKPGKGITLEMYIRNTQVNKKVSKKEKEMFNIFSHKGNANQNNPEISPNTTEYG